MLCIGTGSYFQKEKQKLRFFQSMESMHGRDKGCETYWVDWGGVPTLLVGGIRLWCSCGPDVCRTSRCTIFSFWHRCCCRPRCLTLSGLDDGEQDVTLSVVGMTAGVVGIRCAQLQFPKSVPGLRKFGQMDCSKTATLFMWPWGTSMHTYVQTDITWIYKVIAENVGDRIRCHQYAVTVDKSDIGILE